VKNKHHANFTKIKFAKFAAKLERIFKFATKQVYFFLQAAKFAKFIRKTKAYILNF
jgi:hypothetical protein